MKGRSFVASFLGGWVLLKVQLQVVQNQQLYPQRRPTKKWGCSMLIRINKQEITLTCGESSLWGTVHIFQTPISLRNLGCHLLGPFAQRNEPTGITTISSNK